MGSFLIGLLGQIASLISGGIGGSIRMVTSLIKDGFGAVLQYNQQGVALARQMGLNAQEAQAYTQVLITRAKDLGHEYGIAAEQVLELQKNLSNSTGRALMLNNEEAERMVQINKLVGSEVGNQFTSEMMNHMGAQLSTVQGAVSKAYATAAKSGLSAAEFSAKVAKNLSMANKLSFKDGVNGIIRMTALSEKLGFNLQSVENAANKFMDLDSAIESSAQLQMLGGAAGAYGSNPLTMAYEANYDPEAFTKRMTNTLGGYATFDAKTGMANVNGMNRDFVKAISQAMGISMDEAMSIAKKQAEIKYKENAFGSTLGNYSREQQDFILNKSYVDTETGHLMMTDVNNNPIDISKGELTPELIKEMQKFDNTTEKDLMAQQAKSLKSIEENLQGWITSAFAGIAAAINPYLPKLQKFMDTVGGDVLNKLVPAVAKLAENGINWLDRHKDVFKSIYDIIKGTIVPTIKFAADHIGLLVGFWLGGKAFSWLMKMPWGAGWGNTVGGTIMKKIFGGGGGGGAAAAATTSASGAAAAGGSGAATAARGASAAAARASSSVSVPTKANPHIFKYGGQTYQYDGQKYRKVLGDNKLGGAITKNVNQLERARLSDIGTRNANAARAAANQAANTTTNTTTNTVNNTAKSGSKFKNLISKTGKLGKISRIGGGAFGAGLAAVQSISALSNYKKQQKELNAALSSGEISKEEYDAHLDEARIEKNKNVGGAIGSGVGAAIGASLGSVIPVFGTALGGAAGAWVGDKIGGFIGENWDTVTELASDAWEGIKDFASGAWDIASKAASAVWGGIKNFAKGAWDIASKAASAVWNGIGKVASGIWNGISSVATDVWNGISNVASDVWNGISSVATDIWGGISTVATDVWNGISNVAGDIWSNIGNVASDIWGGINTAATDAWNGISNVASGIWGGISTVATDAWNSISNVASDVWDGIGKVASNVWDGIGKAVSDIYGGAKTVVGDAYEGAKTVVSDVLNGAKNLLSNPSNESKTTITDTTNIITNNAIISDKLSVLDKATHATGGIIGGNSYTGDKVVTRVNSGEMILNMNQQNGLFNFIKSLVSPLSSLAANPINNITNNSFVSNTSNGGNSNSRSISDVRSISSFLSNLFNGDSNVESKSSTSKINNTSIWNPIQQITSLLTNNNDVKAKPVGDKEYIYTPKSNTQNGVTELTVRDINLNINGTLKLDGGNNSRNIDINQLLNDTSFVSQLKDLITQSINTEMNGGRFLADNSTRRGGLFTSSWGR